MGDWSKQFTNEICTDFMYRKKIYELFFIRIIDVEHDSNYGADADGRRGVPMTFSSDDYDQDSIVVTYPDKTEKKFKQLSEAWQRRVRMRIKEYMKEVEADYPEEPEDDREPEDFED